MIYMLKQFVINRFKQYGQQMHDWNQTNLSYMESPSYSQYNIADTVSIPKQLQN